MQAVVIVGKEHLGNELSLSVAQPDMTRLSQLNPVNLGHKVPASPDRMDTSSELNRLRLRCLVKYSRNNQNRHAFFAKPHQYI